MKALHHKAYACLRNDLLEGIMLEEANALELKWKDILALILQSGRFAPDLR